MSDISTALRTLASKDGRYALEAYIFIYESLQFTIECVVDEHRHVSGQELLSGIRLMASHLFGPLAKVVFEQWGIWRTEDFGEIVFTLVENGLLGKTDEDKKEDFSDGFEFNDAFAFEKTVCELSIPRRAYNWKGVDVRA